MGETDKAYEEKEKQWSPRRGRVPLIWQKYEFLACHREAADIIIRKEMTL